MEPNAAAEIGQLPFFLTGPGETDALLTGMIIFTILVVLLIGVFYLYLHALPERMAHRANSTQLQLVGILALLALFTHNNIFWVAALLIVAIRLPDFVTPINSIAQSLQRLAERPGPAVADTSPTVDLLPSDVTSADAPPSETPSSEASSSETTRQGDDHV